MTIRFRLLGEVEVTLDERPADVGHARQRSVLAALLVEVNRPAPADQLIDRVWADRPPYRARNALSAYVSRLRQLVAGAPGVRIGRGPAGYVVTADPLAVDLHEFRHLVAQARAAGRAADATVLFERALRLWRGEPFAAMDTPWFDAVRTSLQAERFAVVLDRNGAALDAGRHADVLVELTDAVRAHPLDERLAGQLMLAQYRSGRQGDALDTYRAVRERLLDELGTDPGAALRRVHQQILTGDAAAPAEPPVAEQVVTAGPPAAASEPPAPPRPAATGGDLPRRPTSFVGRHSDLQRVVAALKAAPLVTLTGVGGVGKTRLAVEAAALVGSDHPDGVWLCELAPLTDDGPVSHAVAAALRLQQRHGSTIEQTVLEYLRHRGLLLVLDNCEHVLGQVAELLALVVRQCPAVTVLATSREPLGVEGEQILPVDPLPADDAAVLFADRARAVRHGFDPDGEAAGSVAEICRRLDGLPLGIELAAARMRVMNAAEVARRLTTGPRFVSGGSRSTPPRHHSLVAAVDWSYRLLSERERALFTRLSVFAGGFDLDAAHGVCRDPADSEDDTLDLLAGLVDKSMVTADHTADATWYRLLETMRQYGRERPPRRRRAGHRARPPRPLPRRPDRAGGCGPARARRGALGGAALPGVRRRAGGRPVGDREAGHGSCTPARGQPARLRLLARRVRADRLVGGDAGVARGRGAPAGAGGARRRRPGRLVPGGLPARDPARPRLRAARVGGRHVPLRQTRRRPGGHRRVPRADRGRDRPLRAPGRAGPAGRGSAAAELGAVPSRHVPRGGP